MKVENLFSEMTNLSPIQQFYFKKSLFVTGGTGFIGKVDGMCLVIVEKLLRTCDVECIYLLVRDKKGKNAQDRVDEFFNEPLFDHLRNENPDFKSKVTGVFGDCGLPSLGINVNDWQVLVEKVHVVLHAAATMRFDEQLNVAISVNVTGTREMLALSRKMKHLEAFVHVSTAYSNCHEFHIEERFYDPPMSSANAIKLNECLDIQTLKAITPEVLGDCPNTYVLTKMLAEDMLLIDGKEMPIVLFRPAIVIPKYLNPAVGWVNNIYGTTGIIAVVGLGILRALKCKEHLNAELVPVDLCVNSILAAAWDVAKKNYDSPPVYNYVTSETNPITWKTFMTTSIQVAKSIHFTRAVWCPTLIISDSSFYVKFLQFFLHIVPGACVDLICFALGKKFRMLPVYKKIHKFSDTISYFASTQWTFRRDNVKGLWAKLDPQDQQLFFFDMDGIEWTKCLSDGIMGVRRYIINDDDSTLKAAKKRMFRLKILHHLLVNIFLAFGCYLAYLLMAKVWKIIV